MLKCITSLIDCYEIAFMNYNVRFTNQTPEY
jgi:hypothetical protein